MIRWNCRQCGEELEAPDSMLNNLIACTVCGMRQTVIGGNLDELRAATSQTTGRTVAMQIAEARERVEMERMANRPALRRSLAQTAVGITLWVLFSIAFALAFAAADMARESGQPSDALTAAAALLSLGAALGLAWFLGGVVRTLLALSRMI